MDTKEQMGGSYSKKPPDPACTRIAERVAEVIQRRYRGVAVHISDVFREHGPLKADLAEAIASQTAQELQGTLVHCSVDEAVCRAVVQTGDERVTLLFQEDGIIKLN